MQDDKFVFVALTPSFLSLRDQSADWSWQSPNYSGRFVRAFVRFTYNPEDLGDCHVASLLAMTALSERFKQQFIDVPGGTGIPGKKRKDANEL